MPFLVRCLFVVVEVVQRVPSTSQHQVSNNGAEHQPRRGWAIEQGRGLCIRHALLHGIFIAGRGHECALFPHAQPQQPERGRWSYLHRGHA